MMKLILLVDDDPHLLKALERQLSLRVLDWEVTTVRNGIEALRLLGAKTFDLIVTDIFMPDQDGIGVIREMRRLKLPTRIIGMTGGGRVINVDILSVASKLGASAVLEKPFPIELLILTAERMLSMDPADPLPTPPQPGPQVA
jgi:DNA-binding NtrC family response regulator